MSDALLKKIPAIFDYIVDNPKTVRVAGSNYVVTNFGANTVSISGTSTSPVEIRVSVLNEMGQILDRVSISPHSEYYATGKSIIKRFDPQESEKIKALEDIDAQIIESKGNKY